MFRRQALSNWTQAHNQLPLPWTSEFAAGSSLALYRIQTIDPLKAVSLVDCFDLHEPETVHY
jgi:hypothetical protein